MFFFVWISSLLRYSHYIVSLSLFFFKEYIHASGPKAQESELKISAVFSVSDSPLGKKQNCKLVMISILLYWLIEWMESTSPYKSVFFLETKQCFSDWLAGLDYSFKKWNIITVDPWTHGFEWVQVNLFRWFFSINIVPVFSFYRSVN